jgi:hypothetical protein
MAQRIEVSFMSAHEPGEASTLFERYFAEGDLDGLMSLYESEAVFPTANATATGRDDPADAQGLP